MAETDPSLKDKIRAIVDGCDEAHAITGVDIAAKLLSGYAAVHYHLSRMVSDCEIERSLSKPWKYCRKFPSARQLAAAPRAPAAQAAPTLGVVPDAEALAKIRQAVTPGPAEIAIPVLGIDPAHGIDRTVITRVRKVDTTRPAEATFHIDGEGRIDIEHGADSLTLDPLNTLRLRRFLTGVGPLLDLLEHDARAV